MEDVTVSPILVKVKHYKDAIAIYLFMLLLLLY